MRVRYKRKKGCLRFFFMLEVAGASKKKGFKRGEKTVGALWEKIELYVFCSYCKVFSSHTKKKLENFDRLGSWKNKHRQTQ